MRAPRLAISRLIRQEQPTSKLSYRGKLWAEGAQNWRPHTFWPKLHGRFWRSRPQNIWQTDERRMVVARKWCNNSGVTEEVKYFQTVLIILNYHDKPWCLSFPRGNGETFHSRTNLSRCRSQNPHTQPRPILTSKQPSHGFLIGPWPEESMLKFCLSWFLKKKLYLQTSSFGESLFGNETKKWAGCSVKISFCNNLDKLTIFLQFFFNSLKVWGTKSVIIPPPTSSDSLIGKISRGEIILVLLFFFFSFTLLINSKINHAKLFCTSIFSRFLAFSLA